MLALSIRQPFAELILRGIKTIEYRSRGTKLIGERFYIYAAQRAAGSGQRAGRGHLAGDEPIWSPDLAVERPPDWMIELAEQMKMIEPGAVLPRGAIVGSAVIENVTRGEDGLFRWHLSGVERAKRLRKPTRHPQPVWFKPF